MSYSRGRKALNDDGPATRIPLHMSTEQIERLDAEVERLELPRATLMRAIFDAYFRFPAKARRDLIASTPDGGKP